MIAKCWKEKDCHRWEGRCQVFGWPGEPVALFWLPVFSRLDSSSEKRLPPQVLSFWRGNTASGLFFAIFRPPPKPNGDLLRCIDVAPSCAPFPREVAHENRCR